jgi:hypothetical protein
MRRSIADQSPSNTIGDNEKNLICYRYVRRNIFDECGIARTRVIILKWTIFNENQNMFDRRRYRASFQPFGRNGQQWVQKRHGKIVLDADAGGQVVADQQPGNDRLA